MLPTSLSSGALELIASPGSTLRFPGPASGIRPSLTNFERSLCAPRSAPGSRGGTSASVSAATGPATTAPARPVDDVMMKRRRDRCCGPADSTASFGNSGRSVIAISEHYRWKVHISREALMQVGLGSFAALLYGRQQNAVGR